MGKSVGRPVITYSPTHRQELKKRETEAGRNPAKPVCSSVNTALYRRVSKGCAEVGSNQALTVVRELGATGGETKPAAWRHSRQPKMHRVLSLHETGTSQPMPGWSQLVARLKLPILTETKLRPV